MQTTLRRLLRFTQTKPAQALLYTSFLVIFFGLAYSQSWFFSRVQADDVVFQVTASSDDARIEGAAFDSTATTELYGGDNTQYLGLRFTNVTIPQGETITAAAVQIYAPSAAWQTVDYIAYAELSANCDTFSAGSTPATRTLTTASATHSSNVSTSIGWTNLEDMTSVIQEVISQPSWTSGNSLCVIIRGNGGQYSRKSLVTYDGDTLNAPKLAISYGVTPTPTPTATPTPTPTPTPQTSIDWPQFQFDAQHAGRTTVQVDPPYMVTCAWLDETHVATNFVSAANNSIIDATFVTPDLPVDYTFPVIVPERMQMIVGEGKVFFGAQNGKLYAVDAQNCSNQWNYDTSSNGILGSPAYTSGYLVFGALDGKIYALNPTTGALLWSYQTGGPVVAPPVIDNGKVYIGSRSGVFYAFDITTGDVLWQYQTRMEPADANSPLNGMPIVAPAVLSSDGQTVIFVAENMFAYALSTSNGTEAWTPVKMMGQSTWYTFPVIHSGKVFLATTSVKKGAEETSTYDTNSADSFEALLTGMASDVSWADEKSAVLSYLSRNPHQQVWHVLNVADGTVPYTLAMGRVTGNNSAPFPPVIHPTHGPMLYWRSRTSTLLTPGPAFGTSYCPDISGMDPTTGDRIKISLSTTTACPELDNGFWLTLGGDILYLQNPFRGVKTISLTTGTGRNVLSQMAKFDYGDFRATGYDIILFGNDSSVYPYTEDPRPAIASKPASGNSALSIASINGTGYLYMTGSSGGGTAQKGSGIPLLIITTQP